MCDLLFLCGKHLKRRFPGVMQNCVVLALCKTVFFWRYVKRCSSGVMQNYVLLVLCKTILFPGENKDILLGRIEKGKL